MSLSVEEMVREYWTARRNHAMAKARKIQRLAAEEERRGVSEEYFDYGPSVGEMVELWVEEARRCNRAMVADRNSRVRSLPRAIFESVNG